MTLKAYAYRTPLNLILFLAVLAGVLFNPIPAFALGNDESDLPTFAEFSKTVKSNQTGVLTGVYVNDVLALPIVQQPAGNAGYVSSFDGQTTQFGMASQIWKRRLAGSQPLSRQPFHEAGRWAGSPFSVW